MKRTGLTVGIMLAGILVIFGWCLFGIIEEQEGDTLGQRIDAAYHAYMPMSGSKPLYIQQLVGPDMGTKPTIIWETTEFENNSVVKYKLKGADESTSLIMPAEVQVIKDKESRRYVYSANLCDLEPEKEYVFQVGAKDHTNGVWHSFSTRQMNQMTAVDTQDASAWRIPKENGSVQIVGVKKYDNHICLHGSGHDCSDVHPNTLICYNS